MKSGRASLAGRTFDFSVDARDAKRPMKAGAVFRSRVTPFDFAQNLKNQIMTTNLWVEQVSAAVDE